MLVQGTILLCIAYKPLPTFLSLYIVLGLQWQTDTSWFLIADFATLLTGRTSSMFHRDDGSPAASLHQASNNHVATGRFTFHRKNLYYSFYVSDPLYRPRALQFSDFEGNILGEQALFIDGVTSVYQNVTGKVTLYFPELSSS
jgi:hypothetical protein